MDISRIVVLGAGVSGLTTALLLSKNPSNKITVTAKHMPGDYDIEYCSPWAGANYFPVGAEDSAVGKWERETWPYLQDLAQNFPEAGIQFQDTVVYNRLKDKESITGRWFAELTKPEPWYRSVVPNVPKYELKDSIDSANRFTSVCINTAVYLPWLVGQCRKNGVEFKRAIFTHVTDAADSHMSGKRADIVINCTGLSSRTLGGVWDSTLSPARGQIVVVQNDPGNMQTISGTDDADDEITYLMARASGGGTILGGSLQKNNWDPLPDPNLAIRIMKRCVELCPNLVEKGQGIEGLNIIRHSVGLRPLRHDGPRVEKEKINEVLVVHNYGHGGYGYQTSYGCATDVMRIVELVLQHNEKAKL
ncbi:D-amino-acid oxidase [Penicillium waksmanii]|uniref:D-amino-acid oxidase n=1 Tax=Penicillium waksmanii TaxID=69791 RepID=UPI0025468BD3|nr:D-amino-acid oxidase [Penicillium waksmanii]KAJ5976435.1 D-amino-acid oxidase [Penicillium waksmanii]